MSFGSGIGDIIAVSTLAWKVFKSCKDASEDFQNLSGEVVSLHVVLKETHELVVENDMSIDQASQLERLTKGCQKILEDLERILDNYRSLGTKSQRTWDRMRWGTEGIANVRARLISNTTMLSAYNTTMVNSSMVRMERKLNQFMDEVRCGKREGSVVSTVTDQHDEGNEEEAWSQLRRELEDIGVSPDVLSQHRQFIVSWFQKAIAHEQPTNAGQGTATENKHPGPAPTNPPSPGSGALSRSYSTIREEEVSDGSEVVVSSRARSVPKNGESLLLASERGEVDIVAYLLHCGVDVNYREMDCMTSLGLAAMYGFSALVQLLLQQPGVRLNIKNHLGHTPLSLASWYGHVEVVQILLENTATEVDPIDRECGQTPLSLATEQGNTPIVRLLLAKSANPNSQDNHGLTPLAEAAKKGRSEETKVLLAEKDILPDLSDSHSLTPLAQAVDAGNDIIVRLLLSRDDVNIDAPDKRGITPFDRVMRKGYIDMVPLFEQAKARKMRSTHKWRTGFDR